MCSQMLMHAIARGAVGIYVKESALKVDSRRKIPRRTGEPNLRRRRAGPMLLPAEPHTHPIIYHEIC